MLLDLLLPIAVVAVVLAVACVVIFSSLGKEKLEVDTSKRTPFELVGKSDNSLTFSTCVEFANMGTSCAIVPDCFVRTHLPFEQYDGVDVRGRAEQLDRPREDGYFEAVLIQKLGQKGDKITVKAQLDLLARKGMSIEEALSEIPDFTFQIIWLEGGRVPFHYRQVRIEVPSDEIRAIAGVERKVGI